MYELPTVNLKNGIIGFRGPVRGVDDRGHDVFQLKMSGAPVLYGEFRQEFTENHNDFNIEIVAFGFLSEGNVGNSNIGARKSFSSKEIEVIKDLITSLFTSPDAIEARKPIGYFWRPTSKFLGNVDFIEGWVVKK